MQTITVLGSTGSIGVSTLDVIAQHPDRYRVFALTAHNNIQLLAQQCAQFQPQVVVVGSAKKAKELTVNLQAAHIKTHVLWGTQALCQVAAAPECNTVMAAIVGAAGLPSTLAAARAGKRLLLANKEALVVSGALLMEAVKQSGAVLLPIDSEHNAIFQCLPHTAQDNAQAQTCNQTHTQNNTQTPPQAGIEKIILTASGGPFRTRALNTLHAVTPAEAVAHPNWVMGRKISVDSATMMNKGLEVIEAHWLFAMPAEKIEVLIHPQSIVHSMVSYSDGSVLAQLGNPDMRTPIAYGLAWPERIASGVSQLDLTQTAKLEFFKPDYERFPCLSLAYAAMPKNGARAVFPCVLNAANEMAVEAFLNQQLNYTQIAPVIEQVLSASVWTQSYSSSPNLEELLHVDQTARAMAQQLIQQKTQ